MKIPVRQSSILSLFLFVVLLTALAPPAAAQQGDSAGPLFSISMDQAPDPGQVGITLQIFFLMMAPRTLQIF